MWYGHTHFRAHTYVVAALFGGGGTFVNLFLGVDDFSGLETITSLIITLIRFARAVSRLFAVPTFFSLLLLSSSEDQQRERDASSSSMEDRETFDSGQVNRGWSSMISVNFEDSIILGCWHGAIRLIVSFDIG